MISLTDFKAYVELLVAAVPEISKSFIVMDDSQITKFIEDDISIHDNQILIGIIPKHNPIGEVDSILSNDTMSFLVLKKIDRSDSTHEELFAFWEASQQAAKKIIIKMMLDYQTGGENCNLMARLDTSSIDINPIGFLAGCDGYEIDFSSSSSF